MKIEILNPEKSDLYEIIEIFNQAIRSRFATGFQEEFKPEDMADWFAEHNNTKYPLIVAKSEGKVVGWSIIKPYRKDREAFAGTMEVSYFVHYDYHRKGIGKLLLQGIEKRARELGYSVLVAILMHVNEGSVQLLLKNGFDLWGHLPQVGNVDGTMIDHLYFGKNIK